MTMTIEIQMDVRAALVEGRTVRDWEPVEVSTDGMGEYWVAMVRDLDMSVSPPRLTGMCVSRADMSEVVRIYRDRAVAAAAAERQQVERIEQMIAAVGVETCEIGPRVDRGGQILGWQQTAVHYLGARMADADGRRCRHMRHSYAPSGGESVRAAWSRYESAADAAAAEVQRHNDAVLAMRRDEWDGMMRSADETARATKAVREAADIAEAAAAAADRLQRGVWEMATPEYDQRTLGRPWCARVTFPSGPRAEYEFGESSGSWGKSGVMSVPCAPGDIVAWGQKNTRRPDRSTHHIAVMEADGRMREVSVAEAYRLTAGGGAR